MKDLLKKIFVWFDDNQGYFEEVGADYDRIVNEAITECGGENAIYTLLAAVPDDAEIMNAIHKEKPIEPQNGFENAMMKREYVAGFLTALNWMQKRHCS